MGVVNENEIMERGFFTANGYTFMVKPIYLGEEDEYLSEVTAPIIPMAVGEAKEVDMDDDKTLSRWIITLFSQTLNGGKKRNHGRIYEFFCLLFRRRDYRYYSDVPAIQPHIKWLERKVTYKNKKVRFYDLERKFGLSKADIERLFIYFHELSGF